MTMEQLSNFVGQNYFWILIIGIVLIMALIGFIADKKNLVKLEKKHKNVDDTSSDKNLLNNIQKIQSAENVNENIFEEKQTSDNEDKVENLYQPLGDVVNDDASTIEQSVSDDIPQELYAPLGDAEVKTINGMEIVDFDELNQIEQNTNLDSDYEKTASETNDVPAELYAPLDSSAGTSNSSDAMIDIDLPDLNTVNQDESDSKEENEVWKF